MSGYYCPECNSTNTTVRKSEGGAPFKRNRYCRDCETRFQTIEMSVKGADEVYLDYVSKIAGGNLLDRFFGMMSSERVRLAMEREMKARGGIRKGTQKATDIFT